MVKQYDIDNGLIGGFINAYSASMWITIIATPLNYFMVATIYLKSTYNVDLPFYPTIIYALILNIIWVWIDFSLITRSRIKQGNRQLAHENPILISVNENKKKLDEILKRLDILEDK